MSMLDTSSPDSSDSPLGSGNPSSSHGQGASSSGAASSDKNFFYNPWYRFALLLTGNPEMALEILSDTLEEASGQLAEFRTADSKATWLLRTLQEKAKNVPLPDGDTHWASVAMLPEGEKTAFALFHCFPWDVDKLAELSAHRSRFAELLSKARSSLAPDGYFPVDPALTLHRPWVGGEPERIAKSVESALSGGDKTKLPLEAQIAFDREWHEALEEARIPRGVELPDIMGVSASSLAGALRQPAVLAIAIAFLVVIGVVCFTALRKMEDFPGREIVNELVVGMPAEKGAAEAVGGVEAGTLEDWFLLKGFEGFKVPSELAKAKVESCRVLRFSGEEVAQLNLEERNASLLVFRISDLSVNPEPGLWTIYQDEENAIGVKREGPLCYVLTYQGDSREMNDLLRKLNP